MLPAGLPESVHHRLLDGEELAPDRQDPSQLRLVLPLRMQLHGGRTVIVGAADAPARPDPVLIKALRAAHAMLEREAGEPMLDDDPGLAVPSAAAAPCVPGARPAAGDPRRPPAGGLTLKQLLDQRLPLLWTEQIGVFGQIISG